MHPKLIAFGRQPWLHGALTRVLLIAAAAALTACGSVPPHEEHLAAAVAPAKVTSTEVMFIHGMFVTPSCWDQWRPVFEQAGYQVSAPPWPAHAEGVAKAHQPASMLAVGQLRLTQVLDHYRALLKDKPVKPILIGHSMGGLVAQILLSEGLAQAAVVIDSAPPKGILFVSPSFLRANWKLISPFANADTPVDLTLDEFEYAFASQQTPAVVQAAYASQVVPESRHMAMDALSDVGRVDPSKPRGPLLMIAGQEDHIIPAALNYKNFDIYRDTPNQTDFLTLAQRDHWLIAGAGWQEVAAASLSWVQKLAGR